MKNFISSFGFLFLFLLASFGLTSCQEADTRQTQPSGQYEQAPAQKATNYAPADSNEQVESENGDTRYEQAQASNQPQYQQEEDHTLRNGVLAAGAGYLAGRAHANYNENSRQKERGTNVVNYIRTSRKQNTSNYSRPSTSRPSRSLFGSGSSRKSSSFGSFGSRSRRRR